MRAYIRLLVPILVAFSLIGCTTNRRGTANEAGIKCAYTRTVCENCGVSPVEVRLFQRMRHAEVPQLAITQSSDCISLKLRLTPKGGEVEVDSKALAADLQSCITSNKDLDPKTRDTLLEIVADALKTESLRDAQKSWERCYSKAVVTRP